jgi:hypothetical protein
MNNYKGLAIGILVAHFLIVMAAGHGIGTIGLLQLVTIADAFGSNDFFSPKTFFEHPLFWVVAVTFLGQSLILVSLLKKHYNLFSVAGIGMLFIAFLILVYYLKEQETLNVTIITGTPFFLLCLIFTYKNIFKKEFIEV